MDDDALTTDAEIEPRRRGLPRLLRSHVFVAAALVAAIIGGGLRLIPAYGAHATPGAAGPGASTACAAK
jgi:hypothetical protein